LDLLGFKAETEEDQPEDYHIEFPLARGLRHPITDEYLYPKFSIKDCRVEKKASSQHAKDDYDDGGSYAEVVAAVSSDTSQLSSRIGLAAGTFQARIGNTLERGKDQLEKGKSRFGKTKQMLEVSMSSEGKTDADKQLAEAFQKLPKNLQIQDQNIDVAEISDIGGKKIVDELYDVRNDVHELAKYAFLDKTHTIAQQDAIYFGGKHSKNVAGDLQKLLGTGAHTTNNPVKSMIAVHMTPLVSAIQAFISGFRCGANVLTWQDPILSFWVTIALFAAAFVSLVFPFRLFFIVVGAVVLGPQNYFFIKYIRPNFLGEIKTRQHVKRLKKLANPKKKKVHQDIPTNQPIVTSHTSDNSPPLELSMDQVDKRGIHQVCVPYSQLTYRRDNYWPPQPEYGRCDPHTRGFERSMERMQEMMRRQNAIGIPTQPTNSGSHKKLSDQ